MVTQSPVDTFTIRGRTVLVKRDDKMRLKGSGISGNKARKLYTFNATPADQLPDLVVSHGGAQSNAMLALAAVATSKGKRFRYYTKAVGRWLRRTPSGNFARAMALNTEIIEVHAEDYASAFGGSDGPPRAPSPDICPEGAMWVPQGGACADAEAGLKMLADEIAEYWGQHSGEREGREKELVVVVPAGTGNGSTTAAFLNRHLRPHGNISVATVPCVGGADYLSRQMRRVLGAPLEPLPEILDGASALSSSTAAALNTGKRGAPSSLRKRSGTPVFGAPRAELLAVWQELKDLGLFVDLLYAARAWEVLFETWAADTSPSAGADAEGGGEGGDEGAPRGARLLEGRTLMYVHCGGLEGVSSQLTRYRHLGLLEADAVQ
ncbi:tryptophan synthase beta subunit-like PLP-dependent enzyme [Tribonema minus]|uniref:Tryptophan synthase beta subunit-like PLP-dependent enzyme n=1 Tax=Tribonema minus TaxID=303371 RepID=A0A835YPC9_9STRA|nr:tryptophan synthase beta subunit-like PLP-dependent enzyme [Tribonema minus]